MIISGDIYGRSFCECKQELFVKNIQRNWGYLNEVFDFGVGCFDDVDCLCNDQ